MTRLLSILMCNTKFLLKYPVLLKAYGDFRVITFLASALPQSMKVSFDNICSVWLEIIFNNFTFVGLSVALVNENWHVQAH